MIRNREKNIEVTILSKGVKLSGNIETNSDVLIEGEIQGAVSSNGKVIVTADAFVNGNIIANSLELFGKCLGEIFVQRSVVMGNTSFYQGEVTCESIEIQKGAKFTGEVLPFNRVVNGELIKNESKILNINSLAKVQNNKANLTKKKKAENIDIQDEDSINVSQAYW